MQINQGKLKTHFEKFIAKAEKLIDNKEQIVGQLQRGFDKATQNQGPLAGVWQQLQLFFSLCKDYYSGNYSGVDQKTMVYIIAGLLYLLSPIDFIPDFIIGLGFLDDAFIIGYVYKKLASEMEKYQQWKDNQALPI